MTVDHRAGAPALYSYLPDLVARRLMQVPQPDQPQTYRLSAALLLVDISGFTAATTAAVVGGKSGTERFSGALNAYFGQIIDLVTAHGGDVLKIIGDALLPIWPADRDGLATASRRAAACGLAIIRELDELDVDGDHRLSVKVGLCAGSATTSRVGGVDGKWLSVVFGEAPSQLGTMANRMSTGTVVASPEAWAIISAHFVGEELDDRHVRVHASRQELAPRARTTPPLGVGQHGGLRAFVPDVALARLDAGQGEWLAELRRTTVIFVGVRSAAGGASDSDAARLHQLAVATQRATRRYNGWLKEVTVDEKGTTLVVVFGVPPSSHEDDVGRAVRAALTIRSEIEALGLTTGIGVATGYTFCGPVGNAVRRDFVVVGRHVNLAARLMQAAGPGDVLCDVETHDACGLDYFERLPPYILKGMGSPTDVYRIAHQVGPPDRQPDLVDRDGELRIVSSALHALVGGTGGVLFLEGEPGIGKSRLVDEISRNAEGTGIRTLIGRAAEIEGGTPYHAWRAIFERLIGLEAIFEPSVRRQIVLDRVGSDAARRPLAPLLNPVMAVDLPDNETTAQLTGAVRADNTRHLMVLLLRDEAARGPTMLVLEDAHWLDSASWSLLGSVQSEVSDLLQVVTTRPLDGAVLAAAPALFASATTLRIAPLDPADVLSLACRRTGADRLSPEVAHVIQQRAEGNPLFIEQLAYSMRDAGRIVVDDGLCRVAGAGRLAADFIPDTVQRVINTRLDQLPPAEAMTLKVASVIGHQFFLQTLRDLHPVTSQEQVLLDQLDVLTRLDLVQPLTGEPNPSYCFRHVITQEVAYNLMPAEQSRELHRRLAEWHEREHAADLAPFHAFLAHHWRHAGVATRAIDHLEQAGTLALRSFANEEAVALLGQALKLAADTDAGVPARRRALWQLRLGEAHVNMSRYRQGWHHLDIGLTLLGRPAPAGVQRALGLFGLLVKEGLRRAGLLRRPAHPSAAETHDRILVCRAYGSLAEVSYYGQEKLLPLYCVIRVLDEAEATGNPTEIARGLAGTGALLGVVPLPRLADWYLRRSMQRLQEVEDLTTHEIVEIVVGFYYIGAGRWAPARDRFTSVRRTARQLGDRRRFDDALANLMELEYLKGNLRAACGLSDELRVTAAARRDQRFLAEALIGQAYTSWLLGDPTSALARLDELREMLAGTETMTDDLKLKFFGVSALVRIAQGDVMHACAASEEAMRLTAEVRPAYFGMFLGYVGPAEVHLRLSAAGYPVGDQRALAVEALKRLRKFAGVFPIGAPRFRLLAGRRAWSSGRPGRARRNLRMAVAKAEALDMPYEAALAHLELGRRLGPAAPAAEHRRRGREILDQIGVRPPPDEP